MRGVRGRRAVMALRLASSTWNGPAPRKGDALVWGGEWFLVADVSEGVGLGQYTLSAVPLGRHPPTNLPSTARIFGWLS